MCDSTVFGFDLRTWHTRDDGSLPTLKARFTVDSLAALTSFRTSTSRNVIARYEEHLEDGH